MDLFLIMFFAFLGYVSLRLASHPHSKINKKLPQIRFKRIQISPTIQITIKGGVIHFHHWFNFTIFLIVSIFISNNFLDSSLTRGFLVGGVLQGLRFPDRNLFKKFIGSKQ